MITWQDVIILVYTLNKHGKFLERWAWNKPDIQRVLSELVSCDRPIIHICSGCSSIGDIRIDRWKIDSLKMVKTFSKDKTKYRGTANVLGNMAQLSLKSGIAGTIICDPPYNMNSIDHEVFRDLIREICRILKPNGKLIYIAPWIPASPLLTIQKIIPIKIGKNYSNVFYKIMSVSVKSGSQLEDF